MNRLALCVLLLTGCAALERVGVGQPGGVLGTGVGNWQVSDTERAALNAVRPGLGDMLAQANKPATVDPLDRAPQSVEPWRDATGREVVWPLRRGRTKTVVDTMPAPGGSAEPTIAGESAGVQTGGSYPPQAGSTPAPATNRVDALLEEIGGIK